MARTDGEYRDGPLADKETVRKKGLDERLARRTELADVHAILSQRAGRRFIWRIMGAGKMFAPIFTGNNTTFARAAEHDVMLPFMADCQEFPELYLLMVKESREPLEKEKEDGPRMMETVTKDVEGAD
jgi:hypothetical protein